MKISAKNLGFKILNQQIKECEDDVCIDNCCGQRFIGSGLAGKIITVNGTPGNALGSYLNGASIIINGNVQDAVGDTMNDGKIIVNGNAGDALGYAMRGGVIYVKGDAGYRTGIHMKQYKNKKPIIVVGGRVGSFLGEYLAGGLIIVLGIDCDSVPVGDFIGTGMHGGQIVIRTEKEFPNLSEQVTVEIAKEKEMKEIISYVEEFADNFNKNADELIRGTFYVIKPNTKNPYKQLYTAN